jgi:hypothetical protein
MVIRYGKKLKFHEKMNPVINVQLFGGSIKRIKQIKQRTALSSEETGSGNNFLIRLPIFRPIRLS